MVAREVFSEEVSFEIIYDKHTKVFLKDARMSTTVSTKGLHET